MQQSDGKWMKVMQAEDNTQQEAPSFYSVSAVADMLGMSTDTIRREIASESLPAYKIGRSVRVRYGDLSRWLEGHRYRASESVTQNVTIPVTADYRW
jgi:excisionase family DNA binding protein